MEPAESLVVWLNRRLVDSTEMLGMGVYVLLRRGRPVCVGRAKNVLARVAKHRELAGKEVPGWFPVQGVYFDQVLWVPSHPDRIEEDLARIRAEYMEKGYENPA